MKGLKKYIKYVIWVVLFYFFTQFLIFVGLNSNYKSVEIREISSNQIEIDKAEASKSQFRVYGKVKNNEENNLNGKFIKLTVYDSNNKEIKTEYLQIQSLDKNQEKNFEFNFNAKDVKSYDITITDNK